MPTSVYAHPQKTGTEIKASPGVGSYSFVSASGCATLYATRRNHLDGSVEARHKTEEGFVINGGAEAFGEEVVSVEVAESNQCENGSCDEVPPEFEVGDRDLRFTATTRAGYEGEFFGVDFGPLLLRGWKRDEVSLFVGGSAWVGERTLYGYLDFAPISAVMPRTLLEAGFGHAGDAVRLKGGATVAMDKSVVHLSTEFEVDGGMWIGVKGGFGTPSEGEGLSGALRGVWTLGF